MLVPMADNWLVERTPNCAVVNPPNWLVVKLATFVPSTLSWLVVKPPIWPVVKFVKRLALAKLATWFVLNEAICAVVNPVT